MLITRIILIALCFLIAHSGLAKSLPKIETLIQQSKLANWNKAVQSSIIINAPLDEVWEYASDSTKATDWSVYFDHISPLPGIEDGKKGSLRRCFRMASEEGARWDEMTLEVIPRQFRQIVTFHFFGFDRNWLLKGKYIFVRQLYKKVDEHTTEMTFQTQLPAHTNLIGKMAFRSVKAETLEIFEKNLENIKLAIEGKPRLYLWQK